MLTYTFVIVMAALVFYGGAGINVYSFCCDDCRHAGVEAITGDRCCEIHGHSHDDVPIIEAASGNFSHTHEMCCDMKRFSYDWGVEDVITPSSEPVVFDLLSDGLSDISIIPIPNLKEINTVMPTGPPLCPPRVYLSLLTTLLI